MGQLIEREMRFNVAGNGDVVQVEFPGRAMLERLTCVRVGGGSIAMDMYNRAFTTPEQQINVRAVTAREAAFHTAHSTYKITGSDYADLVVIEALSPVGAVLKTPLLFRAGDDITISSSTNYNGTFLVAWVSDDLQQALVELDWDTADESDVTVALNISATNQELWRVSPQRTGTNSFSYYFPDGETVFHNRDVVDPLQNYGVPRKMYLKFATAANYRVTIAGQEDIGA